MKTIKEISLKVLKIKIKNLFIILFTITHCNDTHISGSVNDSNFRYGNNLS